MSTKGIYTALSGAMAQNTKLETISNNLANASTTGFKKDSQTFKEYLSAYEKSPDVIQVPKVPASIESFYHMQAGDRGYVDASGTYTDFQQGLLKQTGNALDFAIEGKGFFEVLTPLGVRFTRDGSFVLNNEGTLVTKQGYPVLRAGSEDAEARQIKLNVSEALNVAEDGTITQAENNLGNLSLLEFGQTQALDKIGSSLYAIKPNMDPLMGQPSNSKIYQAQLEGSNVNVVHEMTDMIRTTRTFESLQKVIQAYDQMNGKLVNDIPKF